MQDEKLLLTGGQEKILRLWDIASKTEVSNFAGHAETIKIAQWLDNNTFISGGADSTLRSALLVWCAMFLTAAQCMGFAYEAASEANRHTGANQQLGDLA